MKPQFLFGRDNQFLGVLRGELLHAVKKGSARVSYNLLDSDERGTIWLTYIGPNIWRIDTMPTDEIGRSILYSDIERVRVIRDVDARRAEYVLRAYSDPAFTLTDLMETPDA